jgi:hypothetical protein
MPFFLVLVAGVTLHCGCGCSFRTTGPNKPEALQTPRSFCATASPAPQGHTAAQLTAVIRGWRWVRGLLYPPCSSSGTPPEPSADSPTGLLFGAC